MKSWSLYNYTENHGKHEEKSLFVNNLKEQNLQICDF